MIEGISRSRAPVLVDAVLELKYGKEADFAGDGLVEEDGLGVK